MFLKRHLETLGVLGWGTIWFVPFIGIWLSVHLLVNTSYWYIACLYLYWIYYDRRTPISGGRKWKCRWKLPIPRWFVNYFPLRLVKTEELSPDKNYLLACHPHGLLSCGMIGNLASVGNNAHLVFPGLETRFLTLHKAFYIPLYRDLVLACGGCSVSRESVATLLKTPRGGNIVLIAPGGAREAMYCQPGLDAVVLKDRKGFIKLAIENGTTIVPVYSFGETDVYTPLPNPPGSWVRAFQEIALKWVGIMPTLANGEGIFQSSYGILPRRLQITTVVGSPIPVHKLDNPTQHDIDTVHRQYVIALVKLYNTYRDQYGRPGSNLILV